jgi:hypothetical protein
MRITITGASDDLVEIGGGIQEEFSYYARDDDPALIATSDGTLLRINYDRDGIWRIVPLIYGTAKYSKADGCAADDTHDVVTLEGDIKWVVKGSEWARK